MTKIKDFYGTAEAVPFQDEAKTAFVPPLLKPGPFKATGGLQQSRKRHNDRY